MCVRTLFRLSNARITYDQQQQQQQQYLNVCNKMIVEFCTFTATRTRIVSSRTHRHGQFEYGESSS